MLASATRSTRELAPLAGALKIAAKQGWLLEIQQCLAVWAWRMVIHEH
jgi:hypothetical protein